MKNKAQIDFLGILKKLLIIALITIAGFIIFTKLLFINI